MRSTMTHSIQNLFHSAPPEELTSRVAFNQDLPFHDEYSQAEEPLDALDYMRLGITPGCVAVDAFYKCVISERLPISPSSCEPCTAASPTVPLGLLHLKNWNMTTSHPRSQRHSENPADLKKLNFIFIRIFPKKSSYLRSNFSVPTSCVIPNADSTSPRFSTPILPTQPVNSLKKRVPRKRPAEKSVVTKPYS